MGETLALDDRLRHPMIGQYRVGWDEALTTVASGFARIIRRHGPDAVAFYVSGQLLTEEYYVANKLMKGFIGSANIDTNSRLCMASSVAGHLGALTAVLGGLDALVFTAGIGEHAAEIRESVCHRAEWLGVRLDPAANAAGGPRITSIGSAVSAWVIPTDEERMIAIHTRRLLGE